MTDRRPVALLLLAALLAATASADTVAPRVAAQASGAPAAVAPVVLLHGLARSGRSMQPMADALRDAGYTVCNVDYPSTDHAVETLAREHVRPAVAACVADDRRAHFVTHSLGGIIVRYLATLPDAPSIGRVVMLGPPNRGSEVVDKIGDWRAFDWLNGPAGDQLGTAPDSLPNRLGPAPFPLGVIAGRHTINWINSLMIPGSDDGKVAVSRTRVAGMDDFVVLPVTHPLMMRDDDVIAQTLHFLEHGRFERGTD